MPTFFGGDSDDSNESDIIEPVQRTVRPPVMRPAFKGLSDDEEEEKRVVKSAKEKRSEELENLINNIKNSKKNLDFTSTLSSFEDLIKLYEKSRTILLRDTNKIPTFYIRCLSELEAFVTEFWDDKEQKQRLNKLNHKALVSLRQKIRKYNRDFEEEIVKYRENPVESEDEQAPEDFDEESDAPSSNNEFHIDNNLSDSDNDLFSDKHGVMDGFSTGSSSDESWDDTDIDDIIVDTNEEDKFKNIAQYFLKKDKTDKSKDKKSRKRDEIKLKRREERRERYLEDGHVHTERAKMFPKDAEINHEAVLKKLNELLAQRGKKGTDRAEQIELLKELYQITLNANLGKGLLAKIVFNITASIFDLNPNMFEPMKMENWLQICTYCEELLDILLEEDVFAHMKIAEENEEVRKPPYKIRGCILTIGVALYKEFIKVLKDSDAHSTEYIERLRYEPRIIKMLDRVHQYLLKTKASADMLCQCHIVQLELIYYKFDYTNSGSAEEVDRLCRFVYNCDREKDDHSRTRAVLFHIYHHALHDRWFEARDLMLMSHLQEVIHQADVETQILYNRTMVQLGLCAFRHGNIRAAHDALLDIQSSGRAKELLAQGIMGQKQQEKTVEQEKQEKLRQIAFHMHINPDLMECVYLVSAMLLEIPYMASHEQDTRRRLISKSFHHQMKQSEKQPLPGPPENMREHVIAACKLMRAGNWEGCYNFIINEKMNSRVWDLFNRPEEVKAMIKRKIQEESLRTYLFTYSGVYDCISLDTLAEIFALEHTVVHSIISKMIINEELSASWDEPSNCIVMHQSDPSRLQKLGNQLAEKLNLFVENNERLFEVHCNKNLNMFFTQRDKQGSNQQRKQNIIRVK